ncbi:hypothetical protein GH714_032966 [Hevea brasiliensis]|uniref:Pentacotripeptide-repeat region of PRORP domain-containing protein n=1 Tax=Hevea brasiliensis TaxID=3981 RepID=A0A6A6LPH2_HEVBR|nr:hypothetical protein GH714_032966 [Hevea brasiliensis]
MAAKLVCRYFSHSYTPEDISRKQMESPKSSPIPDLVVNPRSAKSAPIHTQQSKTSKPRSIRPNDLNLIKTLYALVDSGSMNNALYLFEKMNHSDTYTWNVIIRGFSNHGLFQETIDFYYRMEREGIITDHFTFPFVIKACGRLLSLVDGQKVHAKLIKNGLDFDLFVCNSLIDMYFKHGYFKHGFTENAEKVFEEMPIRDLVSWNTMVGGYQIVGDGLKSLICFREMLHSGRQPDRPSMISALGGCSIEGCLHGGKEIHCQVIRSGLELDIMVQTSLIDMYAKCGRLDYAESVFNRISSKNLVAWNAIIGGYALNGHFYESFACMKRMQEENFIPDAITMINLLPSCSQLGALLEGKCIHGFGIRKMFLPHIVLETALVDMYGKCGELKSAKCVFGQINEKNLVSWNAMIAAYAQNGWSREALELFQRLQNEPLKPDTVTISSILPAYAELASLAECKQVHAYITKFELSSNTFTSNAMVYLYGKCGDLQSARKYFDDMLFRDVVSWNVMIMVYAIHGFGTTAIQLFSNMREKGIKPNGSTFVSLLSACSICGLVEEGWEFFNSLKRDYNIDHGIEHFGCMLDLLGRTGNLHVAKQFIEEMPLAPTARIWGSLLTASRNNNDIVLAELAAKHILSLDHDNTGCYVVLFNMYAEAGRWEDVEQIKFLMKIKGIVKTIGCCMVEVNGKLTSLSIKTSITTKETRFMMCWILS